MAKNGRVEEERSFHCQDTDAETCQDFQREYMEQANLEPQIQNPDFFFDIANWEKGMNPVTWQNWFHGKIDSIFFEKNIGLAYNYYYDDMFWCNFHN